MSLPDEESTRDADPSGGEPGAQGAYPGGEEDAGPEAGPGGAGYADRDPAKDMPAIPSMPETQDDTLSHDAAPDPDAPERNASE